jgi:hypothetical protein
VRDLRKELPLQPLHLGVALPQLLLHVAAQDGRCRRLGTRIAQVRATRVCDGRQRGYSSLRRRSEISSSRFSTAYHAARATSASGVSAARRCAKASARGSARVECVRAQCVRESGLGGGSGSLWACGVPSFPRRACYRPAGAPRIAAGALKGRIGRGALFCTALSPLRAGRLWL